MAEKKKKITLEDLALVTKKGFAESKNAIKNAIDELAAITKRGFDGVDERFERVDERFEKVDERFDKVDERFLIVDGKFAKIDERFDNVDKEIEEKFDKIMIGQDKIIKGIGDLKAENTAGLEAQKRQEEKLGNYETRIKIVERKVGVARN